MIFKVLDFDKKIKVFKSIIKKKIPQRALSEDDFDALIQMMGDEDPNDDSKFNDFYEYILKEKTTQGFGIASKKAGKKRIAFGCGFVKPSMKMEAANVDFDSGIRREKTYIPLGRLPLKNN